MKLYLLLLLLPFLSNAQNNIKKNNYFDELTKEEKRIMIMKGTEARGSGEYNKHFEKGLYVCKACNNPLYHSNSKFKSNCGWPSFDDEISGAIIRYEDYSLFGMKRIEICCSNCNGHLGHVFEGEEFTANNIRHCVNSLSIQFIKNKGN